MAAKNKVAPIFSRKVFFESLFYSTYGKNIQKIKISLFNKIKNGGQK